MRGMMPTLVVCLLGIGGPSTVVGGVVSEGVFSINGEAGRARPHVGVEVPERASPAVAHGDAQRSIVFVAIVAGDVATADHPSPNPVFTRHVGGIRSRVDGAAVPKTSRDGHLFSKATAADRMARAQVLTGYVRFRPAIASTKPAPRISVSVVRNHRQATEALTCQINETLPHGQHCTKPKEK